tara:strand:+ start:2948 stop:3151 length:204 start_codon:yes stop_codon:yes gene_type:complete
MHKTLPKLQKLKLKTITTKFKMKKIKEYNQNLSSYGTQKEDTLDLSLGLILTIFIAWGLYVGISLLL